MGPSSVWHYIDTIYATSSTLASQSRTSRHIVATRKADFLASLQAVLTRTCYAMLHRHTSPTPTSTTATAVAPGPLPHNADAPSPDPSPSTTPCPSDADDAT